MPQILDKYGELGGGVHTTKWVLGILHGRFPKFQLLISHQGNSNQLSPALAGVAVMHH